jgi:histidinol-phosphate aminotransferase
MPSSRRQWLQQMAITTAGLGILPDLKARNLTGTPGADHLILLNSNENPFGPSPKTILAMKDAAAMSNRYADDYIPLFRNQLASHWKVSPENIAMGAGATEILATICMMLSNPKGHAISASPAYQVWHRQANICGLEVKTVPVDDEKQINLPAMVKQINAETRMLYVCNPNNPTGRVLPFEAMRQQVMEAREKTMVVVDEAYTELAKYLSLATEAAKHKNLLVIKTFSKVYGLAGARLGYAIGHPDTIARIAALQGWRDVSVSMVTCAAGAAALADQQFVQDCITRTAALRNTTYKTLNELGLEYIPSETNFILFNISKLKGDFSERMKDQGILVQYRDHFNGKWCRVSMGTESEMDVFCKALGKISG